MGHTVVVDEPIGKKTVVEGLCCARSTEHNSYTLLTRRGDIESCGIDFFCFDLACFCRDVDDTYQSQQDDMDGR